MTARTRSILLVVDRALGARHRDGAVCHAASPFSALARDEGSGVNAGGTNVGSGLRVAAICSTAMVPSIRARVARSTRNSSSSLARSRGASSSSAASLARISVRTVLISASAGIAFVRAHSASCGTAARRRSRVSEQSLEVGVEVGEVRGVGAEVLAAEALVAERAVRAERPDVVLLGAVARAGPGSGRSPRAGARSRPAPRGTRPAAVLVHRERRDPLDRFAFSRPGHPVVDLGGRRGAVVHQLLQGVDRHPGVRVPLRVAVAQRVEVLRAPERTRYRPRPAGAGSSAATL